MILDPHCRIGRITPKVPMSRARAQIRIPAQLLARMRAPAAPAITAEDVFKPAKPPPGIVPDGAPMAMDANAAVFGWAAMGALSEGVAWLGYPYLAELTQRPEYRRPSEIMAKEMTRKWIKLVSPLGKGGSGADRTGRAEKIQLIAQDLRKFRVRDAFRNALQLDGFFGRAHIFLDFGDRRSPELATPLIRNKSKIGINKLRRLQVVEPMWTYPAQYNASNPLEPTFYSPESWWVNGIEVSASRLLTLVGREVPDMLKPTYSFGGLSLSQMAKPYVDNWLRARQSVSDLMHSFSVMVLKTNMASMLTAPMNADGTLAFSSGDNLWNRIELFNLTRDNRGTMVVDKEMEELTNVSASLASLDKLQAQAQEQMASVVGIPLVVLLGITPSGLNASSEGEIRVFYDWILAQQEDLVRDPLSSVIDVIQINRFGEIDPDITFEFVPLYQLSAKELAEMREIDARTDAIYVEMGAMDPDDIRDTLGSDDEGRYSAVDFSGPAPGPPEVDEADEFGLPVPFPGMPKPGEKPAQPAQPAQPATPAKPASPAAPAQPARQRMPEPQAA